ncbi:MAG: DNA glycosylase [Bacillota bacterium]|nr:DNA glycosylase [Bacillota bacterium]NLM07654.1 hypothetical protein [Clostridiales Family XIII bacterium]
MYIKSTNLNLKQIADSGQCFRMNEISKGRYSLIALGEYVELLQVDENRIRILGASRDRRKQWEEYFDLQHDYNALVNKLLECEDEFLRRAAAFGSGLRILRQEPFEMLISFIISQNKNIPAIKSAVEKLCKKFGEEKRWSEDPNVVYYTFPAPERLATAEKDDLRALGLGYRDEYVLQAARAVAEGRLDLHELKRMDYEQIIEELMTLRGVGKKVANCVALFAFHRLHSIPVDVWIARVLDEIYEGNFSWEPYGDQAGIVQQYMFYYIRNCKQL